jgi:catechol 2,3-dioxygenase-like lactoylglutathione lyase family enzyme
MNIDHVLAVVPVADIAISRDWYRRLLDREPDNNPMDSLIEWKVTTNGWLQVSAELARAGQAQVNFAVKRLAEEVDEIRQRGIVPGEIQQVSNDVEICSIVDPDGNVITLIGNFRVTY